MTSSRRAWETYEANYRGREMAILAGWIQAGESGSIVGLAGAGKSNLLGFLAHRPEVMARYLKNSSLKLVLIQVDLNNLPNYDLATFYRVILRALYEGRAQLAALDESLATHVETLYRKVEDKLDPFLAQSALREALLLVQAKQARLVLVLDPFDQFCQAASTQVLDNMRGLRDSFKTTLCYLIGLRCEVAYIRSPAELGELYEIIDTHICWLGPMDRKDARWVISQVEEATGQSFSEAQIQGLIDLTGRYPALLRAASLWLARVTPVPDMSAWQELLLVELNIQNRLRDLQLGLTGEEEAALVVLQTALSLEPPERQKSLRQIEEKYRHALNRLRTKGLCWPTDESGWRFFSPLLARFVAELEGSSAGKVWHDPATDRFFRGETELAGLSDRDRRLLHHFLDNSLVMHTVDSLIEAAWSEDDSAGVSNEAVQQAIRRLRKQIEPNPARPRYLVTEHRAGYRFFPEGAPQG